MNPRVTDDDVDTITVTLGANALRDYVYHTDAQRRAGMLKAREYVEGWHDAIAAMKETH